MANEPCERCGVEPRLKYRSRCERCDPLCRECDRSIRTNNTSFCNECRGKRFRERCESDPAYKESVYAKQYVWRSQNRRELVAAINEIYGGRCACPPCGETQPLFLEIDHVNNDGYLDRQQPGHQSGSTTFLRKLVKIGVPLPEYQLLCSNCNQGKRRNGGVCPHISSS